MLASIWELLLHCSEEVFNWIKPEKNLVKGMGKIIYIGQHGDIVNLIPGNCLQNQAPKPLT